MPRRARNASASGFFEPGRTYHVANRGADRADLFHSDLDRRIFLSMLAESCVFYGAVCHAYCLMTNHFHVVLEDHRGTVSQVLHRLEGAYARYFNDTRPRRRTGPVFDSRFRAELVDTRAYFDAACAYVLLNPVRTRTPLVASAEQYRWSSAALVCSDTTEPTWAEALVAEAGGVDEVLAAMRATRYAPSRALRRARLEALASGAWLVRERVLGGRAPEAYRLHLANRAARTTDRPFREEDECLMRPSASQGAETAATDVRSQPPYGASATSPCGATASASAPEDGDGPGRRFAGLAPTDDVIQTIREACARVVPATLLGSAERLRDVVAYVLHRFTSVSSDASSAAANVGEGFCAEAVERVRTERRRSVGWERILWTLEWSLRWKLRAGPHRA